MSRFFFFATAFIGVCATAQAGVVVQFNEGAPKDRFTISALPGCTLGPVSVQIDLGASSAGLIFDTTSDGAGVEVFQPLQLVTGADQVVHLSPVADGDNRVELQLSGLTSDTPVAFTVDVDDTIEQRGITVAGREIEGAQIVVSQRDKTHTATFTQQAAAKVVLAKCS